MCDSGCKIELGCLIFVLLVAPIYVLVIRILIKKRHHPGFNSPFYRIAIVTGVVDLLSITNFYLFHRTNARRILAEMHALGGEALFRFWTFLLFGGLKCQVLLVLATAINRYSALTQPLTYEVKWSPKYTNRVIAACLAAAYGSCVSVSFCDVLKTNQTASGYAMAYPSKCGLFNIMSVVFVTGVVSITLLFLYGRMLVIICRKAKTSRAQNQGNTAKKERASRNLLIIATILSAMVECQLVQAIVAAVAPDVYYSEFHQALSQIYTALFSMCNPLLLLACSTDVRKAFCTFLGCKGNNRTVPMPTPKPTAPQ